MTTMIKHCIYISKSAGTFMTVETAIFDDIHLVYANNVTINDKTEIHYNWRKFIESGATFSRFDKFDDCKVLTYSKTFQ